MSDNKNKDELEPTIDLDTASSIDDAESSHVSDDPVMLDTADNDKLVGANSQWPLKLTGVLVFILALVVIYLWQQQGAMMAQIKQNVSSTLEADIRTLQRQLSQQILENQTQFSQYQKQQQLLAGSLEATQGQLQRQSDKNVDLLKAESLLNLANDRYMLMRDTGTSILAMQQAMKQLDNLQLPELTPIREQIQKEINVLQGVKSVDVSVYLLAMSEMIGGVDDFSLMSASRPVQALENISEVESPSSTWETKWQQVLAALKPMLVIRRSAQTPQVVLTQEEARLIRLILKSRYEYVRHALLQKDDRMLSIAVSSVRDWLERYYDMQQASLQSTLKVLSDLDSISFDIDYPPIGDALKHLTLYITRTSTPEPVLPDEENAGVSP